MVKLSHKISRPIILVGIFTITVILALNYQNAGPSFYIIMSLLVLFTFFFGLSIGQSLSSPIKELLNKAVDLRNGNLSSRVYLETKDELSEIAKVMNEIAEEMQLHEDQKRQSEEFIEIKVRARTKVLEETINSLDQKVKNRTIELEKFIKESQVLQLELQEKKSEVNKLREELTAIKKNSEVVSESAQKSSDNTTI